MILSNPYPALPISDDPCQAINIAAQVPHSIAITLVVILYPIRTNEINACVGVIGDFQGDCVVLEEKVVDRK